MLQNIGYMSNFLLRVYLPVIILFLSLQSNTNKVIQMRTATLIEPYLGYRNIILIKKWDTKWEVEICGSSKHIWVYEDEFIEDK